MFLHVHPLCIIQSDVVRQKRNFFQLLPHHNYIPRSPAESLCFQIFIDRASDVAPGQAASSFLIPVFFPVLCISSFFLQPHPKTQSQYLDITVCKSESLSSIPVRNMSDGSHLLSASQNMFFVSTAAVK